MQNETYTQLSHAVYNKLRERVIPKLKPFLTIEETRGKTIYKVDPSLGKDKLRVWEESEIPVPSREWAYVLLSQFKPEIDHIYAIMFSGFMFKSKIHNGNAGHRCVPFIEENPLPTCDDRRALHLFFKEVSPQPEVYMLLDSVERKAIRLLGLDLTSKKDLKQCLEELG